MGEWNLHHLLSSRAQPTRSLLVEWIAANYYPIHGHNEWFRCIFRFHSLFKLHYSIRKPMDIYDLPLCGKSLRSRVASYFWKQ